MRVRDAISNLLRYHELDQNICMIIWGSEDVELEAKKMNVVMSEEETQAILDNMEDGHDATLGVNWYTIQCHIENVINERVIEVGDQLEFNFGEETT
jgi:hypothetical protein